jgi:hypothetical protein
LTLVIQRGIQSASFDEWPEGEMNILVAVVVTAVVAIVAFAAAWFILRSYARKHNLRIRDMIKPGI